MENKKGLSEQMKIDVKKPLRPQTGDNKGQRPVGTTESAGGKFKFKH